MIEDTINFADVYLGAYKPCNLHNIPQKGNDKDALRDTFYTAVVLSKQMQGGFEEALQIFGYRKPIVNPVIGNYQFFEFDLTHVLSLKLCFPPCNLIKRYTELSLKFAIYQCW